MPPVLQEFSKVNPMTYIVDAVRGLIVSGDLSNLGIDLVTIAVFVLAMFVLASACFRRMIE
jgi:ABC-2 type transport system permease protein